MRFEVEGDHPTFVIELDKHEWIGVKLPDGRLVTVFDDMVYVATEEDALQHRDGRKIWRATKAPYGSVPTQ